MRSLGLIGLVLALLITGLLVKKQLASAAAPGMATGPSSTSTSTGTSTGPSQQIQQYKQSLDAAMKQTRPEPDEAR